MGTPLVLYHTSLRKHVYSNIKKISPPKIENFQIKNSDSLHISAQNIDCGYSLELPRQGSSNEYPQSMFVCLFVLRFYGPVKPMGSCRARSVYLTTHLLGRLSPLSS